MDDKFSINKIIMQIQRLPKKDVQKILKDNEKDINKLKTIEKDEIFNLVNNKYKIIKNWQDKNATLDLLTYKKIACKKPGLSSNILMEVDNLNKENSTIQIEIIYSLSEQERLNLLNNYGYKLSPLFIQNIILALNRTNQKDMLFKYGSKIVNTDKELLYSFIGVMNNRNQQLFLESSKEYIKRFREDDLFGLVMVLKDNNVEYFFRKFYMTLNKMTDNGCMIFLNTLPKRYIDIFKDYFKYRISKI